MMRSGPPDNECYVIIGIGALLWLGTILVRSVGTTDKGAKLQTIPPSQI